VDGFCYRALDKMGFDATVDAYDAGEVIRGYRYKETGLLDARRARPSILFNTFLTSSCIEIALSSKDHRRYRGYRQRESEALQGMAHRTARASREAVNLPHGRLRTSRGPSLFEGEQNVSTSLAGRGQAGNLLTNSKMPLRKGAGYKKTFGALSTFYLKETVS